MYKIQQSHWIQPISIRFFTSCTSYIVTMYSHKKYGAIHLCDVRMWCNLFNTMNNNTSPHTIRTLNIRLQFQFDAISDSNLLLHWLIWIYDCYLSVTICNHFLFLFRRNGKCSKSKNLSQSREELLRRWCTIQRNWKSSESNQIECISKKNWR